MEAMKQNYLTDTRLSLLMRPPSTSVAYRHGLTDHDETIGQTDRESHQNRVNQSDLKLGLNTEPLHTGDPEPFHIGDPELVQYNRNATLHEACEEGRLDAVKYILSKGMANINCKGRWGRTPVMVAAAKRQVKVFDLLVSQGCDLTVIDHHNDNLLHVACIGGNIDIVEKLTNSKKFDIEKRGTHGRTPVLRAAYCGHKSVVDFLVSKGCALGVEDEQKNNILHMACAGGHADMVKFVLAQDIVSINSRGLVRRTPVMAAAEKGHQEVFDILRAEGCNLTAVDENKENILHLACAGGNAKMVKCILSLDILSIDSKGLVGGTPVMVAAEKGHQEVFDILKANNCNLSAIDDNSDNILHLACAGGHEKMVKYVLSLEIAGIGSKGHLGRTPVMAAAVKGQRRVVEVLIHAGCDLTEVDINQDNILHLACIGGYADMVRYLMTLRAVEGMEKSQNKDKETPVQVAERKGHVGIVNILNKWKSMLHPLKPRSTAHLYFDEIF